MTCPTSRKFDQAIHDILGTMAGTGSFKKTVTTEAGKTITYTVSWSTGMGSSLLEHQYKKRFGMPSPQWVQLVHPYHVCLLCKLAITQNHPLPEYYAGIQSYLERWPMH